MNTHSVELNYDLSRLAVLRNDRGEELRPRSWKAPAGGHHVSVLLVFEIPAGFFTSSRLELVIRDVGGVPERLYLRRLHQSRRMHSAVTAGSTGVSATAMLACCAHHLADLLPILGLSAGAAFVNEIKTPLAFVGLAVNLGGIAFMLYQIRRTRCDFSLVSRGRNPDRDGTPGPGKRTGRVGAGLH
ncbi:MAG: hypothetical protein IMX00_07675 [Limnochordales bacterium]|nr:hypothetical protein [Limnochordales bacterium]